MKWRELLQKTLIHFFLIMTTKFTILGSGSSLGIPRIDGYFGKCNSKIKRNYRSRCSALIKGDNLNILIDTSPDLKSVVTTGIKPSLLNFGASSFDSSTCLIFFLSSDLYVLKNVE